MNTLRSRFLFSLNLGTALRTLTCGALLASVAVGCAQTEGTPSFGQAITAAPSEDQTPGGAGREGRRHDPARMLQRLDRNGNGAVEVTELPARMQERLAGADGNHDGTLSAEEMTAHWQAARVARQAQMDTDHDGTVSPEERTVARQARQAAHFAQMDTNSDGAVTETEVDGRRWTHLNRADVDQDGRVTKEELAQAHAQRGGHGRGGATGMHRGFGRGGEAMNPAHLIQRMDRNGNGTLELTEMPERMQTRMRTADSNNDGVLSAAELTAPRRSASGPDNR